VSLLASSSSLTHSLTRPLCVCVPAVHVTALPVPPALYPAPSRAEQTRVEQSRAMGDAADILGVQKARPSSDPLSLLTGDKDRDKDRDKEKEKERDKKRKPKGMSREVFNLMGKDGIAPAIQTNADVKSAGFKNKRQSSTQGKWVWTEYQSSARR
jgi:hypothetical protein